MTLNLVLFIAIIHTNHLDAPIAITNSAVEAVWSGCYTPFGKLIETKNELTGDMALRFQTNMSKQTLLDILTRLVWRHICARVL